MNEKSDKPIDGAEPSDTNRQHAADEGSAPLASGGSQTSVAKPETEESQRKSDHSDATTPPRESRLKRAWTWVKDEKHSGAIQAIFTAVIMATGIIYTVFAGLQSCANQVAATAAKNAASTAKNALEIESRPWISVASTIDVPPGLGTARSWRPTLVVNNFGKSPAIIWPPDHLTFAYLLKDEVRYWKNSLTSPDLCHLAEERGKFPVFPEVPKPEELDAGVEPPNFGFPPDSISGCLVYYSGAGQGPYTTKFVYSLDIDPSSNVVKSVTLRDIEIR